jgi:type IV pilus assembly protein PilV
MRRQLVRGFTLIEVLVTLVILTFGLLGIAGLMAKGQRVSFEAYQRQQAVALATDMAERIRANHTLASICPAKPPEPKAFPGCLTYVASAPVNRPVGAGLFYTDYRTGGIKDCGVLSCDISEIAKYDIALWDGLLNGYAEQQAGAVNLSGVIIGARGCIEEIDNQSATCPAPPATGSAYSRTIRISVAWQGNDETAAPTGSNCGTNLYGIETKRRVVTYDVLVQHKCP